MKLKTLFIAFIFCFPRAFAIIPYVTELTPHSAKISWLSQGNSGYVTFGKEKFPANKQSLKNGWTVLWVELKKLQPATDYEYIVYCDNKEIKGQLRTAPEPGKSFRFVYYGDCRSRALVHENICKQIATEKSSLVVCGGDFVDNGDYFEQWRRQFFTPASHYLAYSALVPVLGNHERSGKYYRNFFHLAKNDPAYYSFDYGAAHIVILDSHSNNIKEQQVAWLKKDLSENKQKWTIVVAHYPIFNIGGHGTAWGRKTILPLLFENNVDIVVGSHSHIYERFVPIFDEKGKAIIFMVSGGGGAPLYKVCDHPTLEKFVSTEHYCLFSGDKEQLTVVVKNKVGKIIDQFFLKKNKQKFQAQIMEKAIPLAQARVEINKKLRKKKQKQILQWIATVIILTAVFIFLVKILRKKSDGS